MVEIRFMRNRGGGGDGPYKEVVFGPFEWIEVRYNEMVAQIPGEEDWITLAVDGPNHGQWSITDEVPAKEGNPHAEVASIIRSALYTWTDFCIYPAE